MESGGKAGKRGRYEEKGGGQRVESLFSEASENEKLKTVYGNYSLWAWLRYWWLDTENMVTLSLFDKGYYDYDFEKVEDKPEVDRSVLSQSQLDAILGVKPRRPTPEQLQQAVLNDTKRATPE